ncbi:hypothetical protein CspHIS471_0506750 [Cutaneotrichosporon sp. HIS471]|nr:hypothetical protein CspHIS471_0506750 [Cutaneotrichosporon sp. HIS471]
MILAFVLAFMALPPSLALPLMTDAEIARANNLDKVLLVAALSLLSLFLCLSVTIRFIGPMAIHIWMTNRLEEVRDILVYIDELAGHRTRDVLQYTPIDPDSGTVIQDPPHHVPSYTLSPPYSPTLGRHEIFIMVTLAADP